MSAHVKGCLCVTVRFHEKLELLMRRGAHSNLSLGKALGGVAHTTVARWREGSIPRGKAARSLALFFDVPVEVLADDSLDLPFQHVHEQAHATDHQDAVVIKSAVAQPKGLSAIASLGDAKVLATQLRAIADQLDPQSSSSTPDPVALGLGKKNLEEIVTKGREGEKGHRRHG